MSANSRRAFLTQTTLAALAAATASRSEAQVPSALPPGAPPAFGTAPAVGPEVSVATLAEAEKLIQYPLTPKDRAQAAGNWRSAMAPLYERRTGPRKVAIPDSIVPYSNWNPILPGLRLADDSSDTFVRTPAATVPPFPASGPDQDHAIAFSPVTHLSHWIESKQLTSTRLTNIYLARIRQFDPKLRCIITLTADHALAQAKAADAEIAAGHYRGPLHGIPYGAKDLLDTAHIPTTWGAEPFRDRIPTTDATVIARLTAAGAVLLAKLSLGALALNDVWFGGQTMNPWLLEEGSSGSSAGPGSATAAGLVAFAIGSETGGSIVSPSMRNGVTGLRPTYGRVPRTGAMTLCWSLDKLGPMARSVEDTMLVLQAITGPEPVSNALPAQQPPRDISCVPSHLHFNAGASMEGKRVGFFPAWIKSGPGTDASLEIDRAAVAAIPRLGMRPVEVSLPDWPYDSLDLILFAEAAAAFEDLTMSHRVDQLKAQVPDAWPNTFRQARFLSAVDYVQADRLRRMVALEMARLFSGPDAVDLLLVPSLRDEMLTLSNFTGHPSLTLRTGFIQVSEARSDWAPDPTHPLPKFPTPRRVPHGVTLIGRLFDEGTIAQAGLAFERHFNVNLEAPPGF